MLFRFRVDPLTGKPGDQIGEPFQIAKSHAILLRHPSLPVIYGFVPIDVYRFASTEGPTNSDIAAAEIAENEPTSLHVLRVTGNGEIRPTKSFPVPHPVGSVVVHPSGRFLYVLCPERVYVVKLDKSGLPVRSTEQKIEAMVGFQGNPFARADFGLTFSQNGRYLYSQVGTGFVDHSEDRYFCYRINPETGILKSVTDERQLKKVYQNKTNRQPTDRPAYSSVLIGGEYKPLLFVTLPGR